MAFPTTDGPTDKPANVAHHGANLDIPARNLDTRTEALIYGMGTLKNKIGKLNPEEHFAVMNDAVKECIDHFGQTPLGQPWWKDVQNSNRPCKEALSKPAECGASIKVWIERYQTNRGRDDYSNLT